MKKVRFTAVLAMVLCVVMALGVAPSRIYANDPLIESIEIQVWQDTRYVSSWGFNALLYNGNNRVANQEILSSSARFSQWQLDALRISDISNLDVMIATDYDTILTTVPLQNFVQFDSGWFFYTLSGTSDPNASPARSFNPTQPLDTLHVNLLTLRRSYFHEDMGGGFLGYSPYPVNGIVGALYHNNIRIGVGTSSSEPYHVGITFRDLGLSDAELENLEVRIIDWGARGYVSNQSTKSTLYSNSTATAQRSLRWYVFQKSEATPPPQHTSAPTTPQPSAWATEQVSVAISANLVPTALQSNYTQPATRAEFAALAVALYETVTGTTITGRASFNDTTDINVQKAGYLGIVQGVGNGNFAPNDTLTREQAAVMLARLADIIGQPLAPSTPTFADNVQVSSWATDAVGQMQASGIMGGIGGNQFAPGGDYTREQSIVTILRLFEILN